MSSLLSKAIGSIDWGDVDSLCRERVPESETLELKSAVPHNRPDSAGWAKQNQKLSDYAKRELVKEIVAIANSYGGHLIIGIKESSDSPPSAESIEPVEACGELQVRLEAVVRDLIEPQLFGVRLRAIESPQLGGTGVVILRISPSPFAPHRSKCDWHVYSRTGTISAFLPMREIQDRTLYVRSAQRTVETRLNERKFSDQIATPPGVEVTSAIRATVVPSTRSLAVPRPYQLSFSDLPPPKSISAKIDGDIMDLTLPEIDYWQFRNNVARRRPCLRGSLLQLHRHSSGVTSSSYGFDRPIVCMEEEISDDGLVELRYFNFDIKSERDDVNERTILGITGHVLMTADRIRTMVGIPGAEYVLEIEVKVWPMPELDIESQLAPRNYEDSFILPRLILEENGVVNALKSVYDDLMNIQGFGHSESFELVKLN